MALSQSQIGSWLAAMRERAHLSQSEAGQRLGKDGQQVSKWERGEKRMSAESFLQLVQVYGATKELIVLLGKWEKATRSAAGDAGAAAGKRHAG